MEPAEDLLWFLYLHVAGGITVTYPIREMQKQEEKTQPLTSSSYPHFPLSPLWSHRVSGGKAEEMKNVVAQFNNAALQYAVYNKPCDHKMQFWDGTSTEMI